ncbi:MAG: Nif3-like dinuclear metal center hexameric protein, partial [Gemmataceae bacterium]|nr:Nif3-like dinuclear metal center hexameric protein [Gemmataceae bacterium]
VQRIMTCLTVTPATVQEAIREQAHLLVSHHPLLFRPVQRLTLDSADGALILPLLRSGIAVYAVHTAYDDAPEGINEQLCQRLGLEGVVPLRRRAEPPSYKLVVFVPESDWQRVSDAVFSAGAGVIGQYRECSFRVSGKGTFFGTEGTQPTIGQKGRREEVDEWRLEVVVPADRLDEVVAAMRRAHSYEEPAYDVYPLQPLRREGSGRLAQLRVPCSVAAFAAHVQQQLGSRVHVVGQTDRLVHRVAVACGAGGELLADALRHQVDVLLTGELRFHEALRAEAAGLTVVVAGHYATERLGVETLAQRLQTAFPTLNVWASRDERDPFYLLPSTTLKPA